MTKLAEQTYLANIGPDGRRHSLYKPFSDDGCAMSLMSVGVIMALMPPPPARILDLGCGGGWTSTFYALRGYQVTGQDIAPDMIDLAIENRQRNGLSESNLDFVCGDYESLGAAEDFDCAVFFDCLHHADDEGLAIKAVHDALKPGGILITHEPGVGHSTAPASIAAMKQFGVNERDMPPSLIVARALEAGFASYRVLPMPAELFQLFYNSNPYPQSWFSKRRRGALRRAARLLFRPNMNNQSIVVLKK